MLPRFSALALALSPALAAAAVARPVSVEELARASDAVVRGTVEGTEARFTADRAKIVTLVTVRTSARLRGEAADRIVVVVPGGEVGEWGQKVWGAPVFAKGEEVVLFLRREGDRFRVNALGLGKFTVEAGVAKPSLEGIVFTGPRRFAPGERAVEPMPVGELVRRVKAASP